MGVDIRLVDVGIVAIGGVIAYKALTFGRSVSRGIEKGRRYKLQGIRPEGMGGSPSEAKAPLGERRVDPRDPSSLDPCKQE